MFGNSCDDPIAVDKKVTVSACIHERLCQPSSGTVGCVISTRRGVSCRQASPNIGVVSNRVHALQFVFLFGATDACHYSLIRSLATRLVGRSAESASLSPDRDRFYISIL